MPLINCEINLLFTLSANSVIWEADRATTFDNSINSRRYKAIGTIEIGIKKNSQLWEI